MTEEGSVLRAGQRIIVRPYEGIEAIAASLEMSRLKLDDREFPPGAVSLPSGDLPFEEGEVTMYLDADQIASGLIGLGIEPDSVALTCIAFGSVVAESHVIFSQTLKGLVSPISVALEKIPFIYDGVNGFDIRIFLHLSRELSRMGSRPSLMGTWLAKAEFTVSPYSTLSRFSPVPLDSPTRRQLGLPKESLSYVRVGDGVLEAEVLEDEIDVFLDYEAIRLLQERPDDPLSAQVQLGLAVSTLSAVIARVAAMLEMRGETQTIAEIISKRRPAGLLIAAAAAAGGIKPDELIDAVKDDPGQVQVCVDCLVKSLKRTSAALRSTS